MRYNILALCLLAAVSGNVEALIGRTAVAGPVKFLVTIKREGESICRGGIIGTWLVLTAASCVYDKTKSDFIPGSLSIVAGHGNATVVADVEKLYVPKDFAEQKGIVGDIAVLKLKQNLNLRANRNLQRLSSPRRLRDVGYKNYVDEKAKVATYDENDKSELPFLLNARVIADSECVARLNRAVEATELCAKIEDNSDTPLKICDNDLGSPLVFNDRVVIGVAVVPTDRCILNGEPSIYTRVSSYLPFVEAARSDESSPDALVKLL